MKTVYTCFTTDVIHEGHLNIIKEARKYGDLIIGVLSDKAMVKFDRFPTISFDERFEMMKSLSGVSKVVKQDDVMYDQIVNQFHPDFVIIRDYWNTGHT